MRLDAPLVDAVGDKTAKALAAKLDLRTVGDLLHHYPRRYFVRGALTKLSELEIGEHVTVLARVRSSGARTSRNGKLLGKVVVTDGSGELELTFFGRVAKWHTDRLKVGSEHLFAGVVSVFNGTRQLAHPEIFYGGDDDAMKAAGTILSIYPAANGADTIMISKAMQVVLAMADLDDDPLPIDLRLAHDLMTLREALTTIHHPQHVDDVPVAKARLTWDESFVLQVVLARRRAEIARQGGVPRLGRAGGLLDAFDAHLPFVLTDGQDEIGRVISRELAQTTPMHRLLQGEVGSGKTVVAIRAMLAVIDSGGQAALLAPTEVLAQQHSRSIRAMLGPLAMAGQLGGGDDGTQVALLTGSLGAASRRAALAQAADGTAGIVVGTHALLSEGVEFRDLGLVVIDEQHRFGVEQRDSLRAKGTHPHVLVMTATPIPRTVAMTTYGDLEVSTLRELPAGRSPIISHVVGMGSPSYPRMWEVLRQQVAEGHQAFVVCPRIGDEEVVVKEGAPAPAIAVLDIIDDLVDGPLRDLRVAALHGRMPSEHKDGVMARFAGHQLDVLVSTTVVEVGVDVPNATVVVVLDADRFGISQLHQLRGRVGRGGHAGTCFLVSRMDRHAPPVERLFAVAGTLDGFELSQIDLQLRREGDVLGADQSGGRSSLRFLQLDDLDVITATRDAARDVVRSDPDLTSHPALKQAVDAILNEQRQAFIDKT